MLTQNQKSREQELNLTIQSQNDHIESLSNQLLELDQVNSELETQNAYHSKNAKELSVRLNTKTLEYELQLKAFKDATLKDFH